MELLPGAVEPAIFTVTTDVPLTAAPGVEWDADGTVTAGTWLDPVERIPRRFAVDVAHPSRGVVAGARTLAVGTHTARLHVTDGARTFVRSAPDTVVVKPTPTVTA